MTNKELKFFKLVAVAGIMLYLYKAKKSGVTINGMKVNPEKIAGLAAQFVPPEYRKHAVTIGSRAIERIMQ